IMVEEQVVRSGIIHAMTQESVFIRYRLTIVITVQEILFMIMAVGIIFVNFYTTLHVLKPAIGTGIR
ncbi:hypothetical protein J7L85_04095, partial [candidate division WOR-3 bacterium]|nr:hypothetical protein [candidate division WOR-3 bacterium]